MEDSIPTSRLGDPRFKFQTLNHVVVQVVMSSKGVRGEGLGLKHEYNMCRKKYSKLYTVLSYLGVVYLLYMLYFKMSYVCYCWLSCVYCCSCLVCIVVVLCVLLLSCVYCC